MYEKLRAKLKYSINLGVDFLIRNIWENGKIFGTEDLYQQSIGTLCIVENSKDITKTLPAIKRIASFLYSKDNSFFIYTSKADVKLTALAAIIFLYYNEYYANKCFNFVDKNEDENVGLLAYMYLKFYLHNKDTNNLRKAKNLIDKINNFNYYWNILSISSLNKIDSVFCRRKIKNLLITNSGSFDILCHFGKQSEAEWKNVEVLALQKITEQIAPSDRWRGGAFVDETDNPRLDWSFQNISSFRVLLESIV